MDLGGPDVAALSPIIPACIIEEVIVVLELRKRGAFPTFPTLPTLWCVCGRQQSLHGSQHGHEVFGVIELPGSSCVASFGLKLP